jgi:hypothetical protein
MTHSSMLLFGYDLAKLPYALLAYIILSIIGLIYWGGIIFQKADIVVIAKHQLITYKDKQFNVRVLPFR